MHCSWAKVISQQSVQCIAQHTHEHALSCTSQIYKPTCTFFCCSACTSTYHLLNNMQLLKCSACPSVQFLALSNSHINTTFLPFDQAVMDSLDSVEVAPAKAEGDSQSSYAAEEQLWRHEFFRDCLAPKKAAFKVKWVSMSAPACSQP